MYTAFPTLQELSICLRCQYRLVSNKGFHLVKRTPPVRRQPYRPFSSLHTLYQEHSQEVAPLTDVGYGEGSKISDDGPIIRYEPVDSVTSAQRKVRKQSLGVEVLGRPGETIILENDQRERGSRPLYAKKPDTNPTEWLSMSSSEILEKITKEQGIISADQACENIETLRQSIKNGNKEIGGPGGDSKYQTIASKLRSGFNAKQLYAYIERSKDMSTNDAMDLRHEYSCDLSSRSSWMIRDVDSMHEEAPPVSKADQREDSTVGMATPINKSMTKNILIEHIMRRYWRMSPDQEVNAEEGVVDLRLLPAHFDVIVNHRRNMLKKISDSYGIKLTASRPRYTLRLTSDFEACCDIVELLKSMIENIKCYSGAFTDLRGMETSARHIVASEIEKATSTVIKQSREPESRSSSIPKLEIYFLGPETSDLDDALRMLQNATSHNEIKKRNLLWSCVDFSNVTASPPVDIGSTLPIRSRHIQWSRWCTPETIGTVSASPQKETPSSQLAKRHKNTSKGVTGFLRNASNSMISLIQDETPGLGLSLHWSGRMVSDTTMTLGRVVFPTNTARTAERNLLKPPVTRGRSAAFQRSMTEARREILTTTPGMLRLLQERRQDSQNGEHLYIILLPMPPPDSPLRLANALPTLELRVGLDDENQTAKLDMARLIINHEDLDVLLPRNLVDVRVSQQISVRAETFAPALQEFIQSSNLDVWGNERLATPNSLSLTIPGYAIRSVKDPHNSGYAQGVSVDYTFASLEHHSRIGSSFSQDTDINYTIIEAGRTGGRREELSILPRAQPLPRKVSKDSPLRQESPEVVRHQQDLNDAQAASLWLAANQLIEEIEGAASSPQ